MRRSIKLALTCLAAGAVGACDVDTVVETEAIPTAGVRFINAVPDTGAMDFRFIDMVENTSHWNVAYRNNPSTTALETNSLQVQFKNARAGSRTYKIFMTGTTPAVATDEVLPAAQTVTLNAGSKYTILLMGYANPTGPGRPAGAPAMTVQLLTEDVTVPAGNVAIRVINASNLSVAASYYTNPAAPAGGSTVGAAPAGTSIVANLAAFTVGTHVNIAAPATLRVKLEPVGGGGTLYANQIAMIGTSPLLGGSTCPNPVTGPCDIEGSPGTTQAGSAVTAIVFPAAVSPASNTGMTITTGNTPQRVTATGNYAAPRDYLADGFFVGQEITASNFTNAANNGAAQITGIVARASSGTAQISATATGYARATGSFITNGFAVGQEITASGFTNAANNGRSVVTAVTATALTVTKTGGTVAEAAATGRNVISDGEISVNKVLVTEAFPTTNRTIAGTRGRLMSFVWDARPPRPAGT